MGDYPARQRRQGQAGRRRPHARRHRWRRPLRQGDHLPRRPRLPDRPDPLAQRACSSPAPRHLLRRGPRRRRQGRPSRGPLHRLPRGEPAAPAQRLRPRPRRLGLRRQRRQRRQRPLAQDRRDGEHQRPRLPLPARRRPVRGRERPDAVRPAPRRLGPLVRQQQPELRPGNTSCPTPRSAATRGSPSPTRGRCSSPTPASIPSAGPSPGSTTPDAANRVTSANSPTPYRDDLFGPDFATSLFVSEPVHNLVHRMVLEPDGADLPRPSRRRTRPTASSSPRATTGPARRCSRPGPTARSGSPTCTAPSSSTPSGSPTTGKPGSTSAPAATRGGSTASIPSDKTPRPIPRLDRLDTAGLVAALDSPNGWQRDTAQRLLLHRHDPAAVEPLRTLAASEPAAEDPGAGPLDAREPATR